MTLLILMTLIRIFVGKTDLVNINFTAVDRQGCFGHGVISRLESALISDIVT